MDQVITLLWQAFLANLFVPVGGEIAWFAWLNFAHPHIGSATILAGLGSVAAMLVNYALGLFLARDREMMPITAEAYNKGHKAMCRYGLVVFLFPWMPFLGVVAIMAGFFTVPFWRMLLLICLSRALYYGYYLLQ